MKRKNTNGKQSKETQESGSRTEKESDEGQQDLNEETGITNDTKGRIEEDPG